MKKEQESYHVSYCSLILIIAHPIEKIGLLIVFIYFRQGKTNDDDVDDDSLLTCDFSIYELQLHLLNVQYLRLINNLYDCTNN
jgi:hypothetical protein